MGFSSNENKDVKFILGEVPEDEIEQYNIPYPLEDALMDLYEQNGKKIEGLPKNYDDIRILVQGKTISEGRTEVMHWMGRTNDKSMTRSLKAFYKSLEEREKENAVAPSLEKEVFGKNRRSITFCGLSVPGIGHDFAVGVPVLVPGQVPLAVYAVC